MLMIDKFDEEDRLVAAKVADALHQAYQTALSTHDVMIVRDNHLVLVSKAGVEKIIKSVPPAIPVLRGTKIMRTV